MEGRAAQIKNDSKKNKGMQKTAGKMQSICTWLMEGIAQQINMPLYKKQKKTK